MASDQADAVMTPLPFTGRELPPRNLHCRHYNACLDVCLAAGWRSWACAPDCDEYEVMTHAEERRDLHGLVALRRAMTRGLSRGNARETTRGMP